MSEPVRETTFPWETSSRSSWRLAGLIFAMLLLHSSAFFLFQASPPAIHPPPRTAPAVQLLTPFSPDGRVSPENQSLLRWIEAEDPALVARVPDLDLPSLQEIPYRPSYEPKRPTALDVPPHPVTIIYPPARDPLSLVMSATPSSEPAAEPVLPQKTRILFSSNLAARLTKEPSFRPTSRINRPVEATRFIVGVADNGETRFVFLQKQEAQSVPALEEEAAAYLATQEFTPSRDKTVIWGAATIQWGDDIALEP